MRSLEGVRVVDLTRALAGPFCAMTLGDLGADVIKVEEPGTGDDSRHWGPPFQRAESAYFLSCNRNKRGITLNLKRDGGREALWRLIAEAGRGQRRGATLPGSTVAALANLAGSYLVSGEAPPRFGNSHLQIAPYDLLHTSDGYANVAVGNDAVWRRFCKVLDLEELLADERFTTNGERVHNRPALLAAIEARTTQLTTAELLARMDEAGVPAGPIRDLREVFESPQAQFLGLAVTQEHPTS